MVEPMAAVLARRYHSSSASPAGANQEQLVALGTNKEKQVALGANQEQEVAQELCKRKSEAAGGPRT